MNRYDLILAAIAATVVAGCATAPTSDTAAAESPDDKTYVTGSRLPVRDNTSSASVKGIANKNAIDDIMNRGSSVYIPPKGSGPN
jgi:hypothetical protein